ncbi:MAG TPA: hypothetical protein VFQ65_22870, partial [Kofleriaceae bacterium]|nr:hypothetical protein [Kofleriaceae bacterium]
MAKQPAKPAAPESDDEPEDLPEAKVVPADGVEDPLRTVKLGGFLFALIGGWLFVLGSNKFHITAPVVFVCLGYFAILMTVVNLWRTGAAAASSNTVDDWQRPLGARGELEKEKKTLLKAIKEAEFDFAMGKLSKLDSDALIRDYRARAIEVIKELDRGGASQLSAKEQIELEVKARLALDAQDKPSNRAKNEAAKQAAKSAAKTARTDAADAKASAKTDAADAKAAEKTDAADAKAAEKSANAEERRDTADAKLNAGSV